MAVRGRPNTSAKKTAKKATPAMKTNAKTAKKSGVSAAIAKVQALLPGRTTQAKAYLGKKKCTASQKLKRAYERRAIRQISQGQLGQARRTLRKKRTVI